MSNDVNHDGIYWLNEFPSYHVLYDTLSMAEIVKGLPNPNYYIFTVDFGSYAQLYTGTKNTNKSRTIGVISIRSAGKHSGYYFMPLETGNQFSVVINCW